MWKAKNKQASRIEANSISDIMIPSISIGARKVALFLSILDSETAERLLTLFDPQIAKVIAEEAKNVQYVSSDDVEIIISEFLNSVGHSLAPDMTDALVEQARQNCCRLNSDCIDYVSNRQAIEVEAEESNTDRASDRWYKKSSLDSIDPKRLALSLHEERLGTIAAVATLLSSEQRKAFLESLTLEYQSFVTRLSVKHVSSSVLKRLEDVLVERTIDE